MITKKEYEEIRKRICGMNDMTVKDGALYVPRLRVMDMLKEFVEKDKEKHP